MEVDSIIKLLIVTSVVVIPMLGITARFALKPIVDAIVRLREGGMLPGDAAAALGAEVRQVRADLHQLHDEMSQVRQEMGRLREAESFHLALRDATSPAASLPAPTE
jgi:hypothetical protein